jgi:hypothetical protein
LVAFYRYAKGGEGSSAGAVRQRSAERWPRRRLQRARANEVALGRVHSRRRHPRSQRVGDANASAAGLTPAATRLPTRTTGATGLEPALDTRLKFAAET